MMRRRCEVCDGYPIHKLDCQRLGVSLAVVAVGVAAGVAVAAGFHNEGGVIRLFIAELLILVVLALNVALRLLRKSG